MVEPAMATEAHRIGLFWAWAVQRVEGKADVAVALPCSILATFDELERLQRGGVGILPEPTVEEIIKRLRHRYEGSADENSPSLASWASPST